MGTPKNVMFITGSHYTGTFNQPLNCMEGYGTYRYPDGSVYHGYFQRGRFHGYGRLMLAPPYSFTFVGEFENGEIIKVEQMLYADGLVFNADFKKGKLNTSDWSYLSKSNRLFTRELCMGLRPVAPHEPLTSYNERTLPPNTYDTVEGIFLERTDFITQIPEPFNPQRHVTCKEVEWIRKHCRRPEELMPVEPDEKIGRAIIENNIKTSSELCENTHECSCNIAERLRAAHLHKACRKTYSEREHTSAFTDDSKDYREEPSSVSTSSMSNSSLEVDLQSMCDNQVRQLVLKDPRPLNPFFR